RRRVSASTMAKCLRNTSVFPAAKSTPCANPARFRRRDVRPVIFRKSKMVKLFEKAVFRGVELSNRIVVSPMGMYSAENGYVTPFHLVHYGKFAMGGAGLVFVEQTSVTRKGRITNGDPGLWEDGQIAGMREIVHVIKSHGAKAAIQINHGGRKSSQQRAFRGNSHLTDRDIEMGEETWVPTGPSDVPFSDGFQTPIPLSKEGLSGVRDAFVATARRAV